MKKLFLTIGLMLFVWVVKAQGEFTMEGKLSGVEDGTLINLYRSEGRLMGRIATDTLRNGMFRFKEKAFSNEPECLMLTSSGEGFPNTWLDVWITPEAKVMITGNDKLLSTWKVSSDVKEQKFQNLYIDATREMKKRNQQLLVRILELYEKEDSKTTTTEEKKAAKAERKELDREREQLSLQELPVVLKLMRENPVGPAWIRLLDKLCIKAKYMKGFPYRNEVIALYNRLPAADKQTEAGKTITTNLFPPEVVKVGDDMADADLYDLDGTVHHLADYKGKYMLVDFWSRGCGPCRMALPEMKQIAEMYKDRLTVISLSSDDEKNWREVSKEENLTWENLNDMQGTNGLYAKYGVSGIPHYVLISPEGKVVKSWSGYGKNSLKLKMKALLDIPKHEMSITHKAGIKQVNYPSNQSSNADNLVFKQVELSDTATTIHLKVYYLPRNWINFSPNTYLTTYDGKKYRVKGAEGVTLGERLVIPESGEVEMTLHFEPLPGDARTFDYMEGEDRNDWQVKGIQLSLSEK